MFVRMIDPFDILKNAEDPLRMGLQTARCRAAAQNRLELLLQVLERFGSRVGVGAAREMAHVAEEFVRLSPRDVEGILAGLKSLGNPAAAWMQATMLEAAGRHAEAAAFWGGISGSEEPGARAHRLLAMAKNFAQEKAWPEAVAALRESVRTPSSYRQLCAADKVLHRVRRQCRIPAKRRCKIALVGTTTLDFLLPALRVGCFAAAVDAEFYVGSFGQYQQEILDPTSGLAAFRPDILIIASDWRALCLPADAEQPAQLAEANVSALLRLWRQVRERLGSFVIQHNFEVPATDPYGQLSAALPGGKARLLRQINLSLWDAARDERGVAILDIEQIASIHGKTSWSDAVLWYTARQYPVLEAIPLLVRHQVALVRAILGLASKCLVLDLDGVLWGGVIGEDDLAGITLGGTGVGEAFLDFQRYLQALHGRGILLAACSKNNEEDAKLPFQQHPEMVLSLDDFTMFVANWRPKDKNLRFIAETLNLGLDSLVFVEDNPTERAWVRQQLPEVEVPEMPQDPALFGSALDRGRYFEALSLTEEDRRRAESYQENVQRRVFEAGSSGVEEFLAGLQMQVELTPFDELNLPRVAQLINKTNQFNLTSRQLTESQVRSLMRRPGCYTQCMRLRDRFGDNGLTGLLIALTEGDTLRIDNWLISCRVLGRRVEEPMLGSLLCYAAAQGFKYVVGEHIPTAKNGQVSNLFDRLGFARLAENEKGERRYQWDVTARKFEISKCFTVEDRTQEARQIALTR